MLACLKFWLSKRIGAQRTARVQNPPMLFPAPCSCFPLPQFYTSRMQLLIWCHWSVLTSPKATVVALATTVALYRSETWEMPDNCHATSSVPANRARSRRWLDLVTQLASGGRRGLWCCPKSLSRWWRWLGCTHSGSHGLLVVDCPEVVSSRLPEHVFLCCTDKSVRPAVNLCWKVGHSYIHLLVVDFDFTHFLTSVW